MSGRLNHECNMLEDFLALRHRHGHACSDGSLAPASSGKRDVANSSSRSWPRSRWIALPRASEVSSKHLAQRGYIHSRSMLRINLPCSASSLPPAAFSAWRCRPTTASGAWPRTLPCHHISCAPCTTPHRCLSAFAGKRLPADGSRACGPTRPRSAPPDALSGRPLSADCCAIACRAADDLLFAESAASHVRLLRWRADQPQAEDISGERVSSKSVLIGPLRKCYPKRSEASDPAGMLRNAKYPAASHTQMPQLSEALSARGISTCCLQTLISIDLCTARAKFRSMTACMGTHFLTIRGNSGPFLSSY